MRTLIVGAGAMGGIFASMIAQAGREVYLYDVDQKKVDTINEKGLRVVRAGEEDQVVRIHAFSNIEDAPPCDLMLLFAKTYNTERAAREIASVSDENTMALTLQNGLGNAEELLKHFPSKQVFSGVTYQSGIEMAPGVVFHAARGLTIVAPMDKKGLSAAMDQARLFNDCQISAGATTDLKPIQWKKLIINSAVNPLSAIYGVENGKLIKNAEAVTEMASLVVEGVAVAQKIDIPLNYGEMWASVLETCRRSSANRSSMLCDVDAGRPTEINAINGSIIALGDAHGVDTPVNIRVLRQIVSIHRGRKK